MSGAVGGRRGPSVRKIVWWELGLRPLYHVLDTGISRGVINIIV